MSEKLPDSFPDIEESRVELLEAARAELKAFEAAEARSKETQKLEAGLENLAELRQLSRELAQEKHPKPSRVKKILQTIALLVVGFGGWEEKAVPEVPSRKSKIVLQEREKAEAVVSWEKILPGLDKIASEAGFEVELVVDNERGDFILHIGQMHPANLKGAIETEQQIAEIVRIQKDIEKILVGLKKNGRKPIEVVFEEGYVEEDAGSIEALRDALKTITHLMSEDPRWFNKATLGFSSLRENISPSAMAAMRLIFKNKAEDVYKNLIKKLPENQHEKIVKDFREFLKIIKADSLDQDVYYSLGAATKLCFEEMMAIMPSETRQGNDDGGRAYESLLEVCLKIKENPPAASEEKAKLLKDFLDRERKVEEFCFEKREDIAIGEIMERFDGLKKTRNQRLIPLVYGDAHNFSNNIRGWNQNNPGKKLGLIDFRHKELKHHSRK
jgi:hypothetical protein